jgi:hypothetical protein
MYYVFIDVLVAPSKFNFPEMTHYALDDPLLTSLFFLVAPLQIPPQPPPPDKK